MDLRSNDPLWPIKNALSHSYPSLRADISSEIVIIGCGITGALMAYQLLKEGRKVIMLDKRDVANGSSAASTGMLQYEIDTPLHELIEQRGLSSAVSSYKNCEKAITDLKKITEEIKSDCGFEFKKSIYFCSSKREIDFLKKEFECREAHGFKVKWIKKEEIEKLGLKAYAAIESESGAIIDAYKFTQDMLAHCSKNGVRIFDRTEVSSIKENNDKLTITTTGNFKIEARHIVHCTGYESTNTLKEKVVNLKSTYALASETFEKVPKPFKTHIFWNTSSPYLYFRITRDNRIVMGGGDVDFKNATKRDALLAKKERALQKEFTRCFPNIEYIPDYAWAGTFGETDDGLPYFGKPDPAKNEHYILGFGGNGITFSVMGMEAVVHSINNTPHPFLEYYKFGR